MSDDTCADGMMTLVPAETVLVQESNRVILTFPSEDDAIIFYEMLLSMMTTSYGPSGETP